MLSLRLSKNINQSPTIPLPVFKGKKGEDLEDNILKVEDYLGVHQITGQEDKINRFNPFNSEIFQFFALIYNKLGGTYVTLPSQVLIQYLKLIHMHGCVYV